MKYISNDMTHCINGVVTVTGGIQKVKVYIRSIISGWQGKYSLPNLVLDCTFGPDQLNSPCFLKKTPENIRSAVVHSGVPIF